jgi:hypothetical protein
VSPIIGYCVPIPCLPSAVPCSHLAFSRSPVEIPYPPLTTQEYVVAEELAYELLVEFARPDGQTSQTGSQHPARSRSSAALLSDTGQGRQRAFRLKLRYFATPLACPHAWPLSPGVYFVSTGDERQRLTRALPFLCAQPLRMSCVHTSQDPRNTDRGAAKSWLHRPQSCIS